MSRECICSLKALVIPKGKYGYSTYAKKSGELIVHILLPWNILIHHNFEMYNKSFATYSGGFSSVKKMQRRIYPAAMIHIYSQIFENTLNLPLQIFQVGFL